MYKTASTQEAPVICLCWAGPILAWSWSIQSALLTGSNNSSKSTSLLLASNIATRNVPKATWKSWSVGQDLHTGCTGIAMLTGFRQKIFVQMPLVLLTLKSSCSLSNKHHNNHAIWSITHKFSRKRKELGVQQLLRVCLVTHQPFSFRSN